MEIQQLRYFVAVARERHFLRASRQVHVSQPTLSQQIRKLERELKTVLFDRSPRNVRLTSEGQRFFPQAVAVLEALERAQEEMATPPGKVAGRVLLGCIPTMTPYILPQVAQALARQAPDITLELWDEPTETLIRYLKEGRIDLALLSLPIDEPGIETRRIGREPILAAVSRKHPLAAFKTLDVHQLDRERLLMLQEGHCFRDQSLEFCHRSQVNSPVVFQGSSLTSVLRMAAAGYGITFVPKMAVHPKESPGLRFIPFKPPTPSRDIAVAWRSRAALGPAQSMLVKILEKATGG